MRYDDGYFEFLEEEERQAELMENNILDNMVRVYKINNGDVVTVLGMLLEFDNGLFYEVEQKSYLINPKFKRTGKKFSPKELNNMFK